MKFEKINNNKKYIYQGKEWALVAKKYIGRVTSRYFVPWENRLDWEIKNIEPIELTQEEFFNLMRTENNDT